MQDDRFPLVCRDYVVIEGVERDITIKFESLDVLIDFALFHAKVRAQMCLRHGISIPEFDGKTLIVK